MMTIASMSSHHFDQHRLPNNITSSSMALLDSSFAAGASSSSSSLASSFPNNTPSQNKLVTTAAIMQKPASKPLNAYNLFFKLDRERLLSGSQSMDPFTIQDLERVRWEHRHKPKRKHRKAHGKISIAFQDLNRIISKRWKMVPESERRIYHEQAKLEKMEHAERVQEWHKANEQNMALLASAQPGTTISERASSSAFEVPEAVICPDSAFSFVDPAEHALSSSNDVMQNNHQQSGPQHALCDNDPLPLPLDSCFEPIPVSWEHEQQQQQHEPLDHRETSPDSLSTIPLSTWLMPSSQSHYSMRSSNNSKMMKKEMVAAAVTSQSPAHSPTHQELNGCSSSNNNNNNNNSNMADDHVLYEPLDPLTMENLFE